MIVGDGPLGRTLARGLSGDRLVVLAGPVGAGGPWLWRRADLESGAGVRAALQGAAAVILAAEGPCGGAAAVAARVEVPRGAVLSPWDAPEPPGVERLPWGRLRLGFCAAVEEPLLGAWVAAAGAGGRVWVTDPGPVAAVREEEALDLCLRLLERPEARWRFSGQAARLPDLAREIVGGAAWRTVRVPLPLAAWRAGADLDRLRRWLRVPAGVVGLGAGAAG